MKGKARGLHPELTEKMNTKSTELRNGWFIATDPENIGSPVADRILLNMTTMPCL